MDIKSVIFIRIILYGCDGSKINKRESDRFMADPNNLINVMPENQ